MGNYTSVLYGYNKFEQELSLEKACQILHHEEEKEIENKSFLNTSSNLVSSKIGTITDIKDDQYIIDDSYTFTKTEAIFLIGSKVKFNLFSSSNIDQVSNVEVLDEWDSSEVQSDSLWNNRIIICQVMRRERRQLMLTNDFSLNLDSGLLEFIPIPGDWLELDVKCIVNEKILDLTGNIIEINKVSPLRLHIETGKVTSWKKNEETGTINNKIFYNKSSLSSGYEPMLGDKVVAEIIESQQNRCCWRAIKILPESLPKNRDKLDHFSVNIIDCNNTHPGLKVLDIDIHFEKLGDTKFFEINILNISKSTFKLISANFLDNNGQCEVSKYNKHIELLPDSKHNIICKCIAKNVGHVKELFTLDFGEFTINKYCNIIVSVNHCNQKISYEYNKLKPLEQSGNQIIRGQSTAGPRFTKFQIPSYIVPQRLINEITKVNTKNVNCTIDQLQRLKPCLTTNLSHLNYEDKFHTLLHLDEISNLIQIQKYDQRRACFIRNGEYLMLEVDHLSERRPSLIVGDKIVVNDAINKKSIDYEGFIHKIGTKHIYLKFNQLFHDSYDGEDYSIKIIPSRTNYRKLHHAIHLAVTNLGQEVLFPNRILEKNVQVNFSIDNSLTSNTLKKSKIKTIMNKMQEKKQHSLINDTLQENNLSELKLEWYNKKLNSNQKDAVMNVLWGKARPLPYVIFGPPGTGKTVTLIEIVLQILRLLPSSRLLVAAPSNSAADLIALKLIDSGVLKPGDLVRVISYNYATNNTIPFQLVPYCATASLAKEDTAVSNFENNGIRMECDQATLGRHRVTVCTCGASGQFFSMAFPKGHFSHIIVDEAAQAGEPDIMIPISFLDKSCGQVILAGDPMQLGPVVLCKVAEACGLSESYLERLINRFPYVCDPEGFPQTCGFDPRLVTKLLYNYRALPDILNLYNMLFYRHELVATIDADDSGEAKLLQSLEEILPKKCNNKPSQIVFHGVDGENYQTTDSPSWFNPHEAAQVFYYVNELYRLGIKSNSIGIITPYVKQETALVYRKLCEHSIEEQQFLVMSPIFNKHESEGNADRLIIVIVTDVKEIRSLLTDAEFDLPRVGTIEEFQGQEYDIVILSTVRSCEDYIVSDVLHHLGFIASPKRLNVAISRSKCLLIIIGNPKLLKLDTFWRSVVKYCIDKEAYVGCDF